MGESSACAIANQLALSTPKCGVPKKSMANVDRNMEYKCSTFLEVLVEEYASAFFTNIPPRPWQMKIMGRLEQPSSDRSACKSATSVCACCWILSADPLP